MNNSDSCRLQITNADRNVTQITEYVTGQMIGWALVGDFDQE
jgi:hypothetical protein